MDAIVSEFFAGNCQLLRKENEELLSKLSLLLVVDVIYNDSPLGKTLSGSSAEFYIRPPRSCIDDTDIMLHSEGQLAFDTDNPVLPRSIRNCQKVFECLKIKPCSNYPGYVTLRYVGRMNHVCALRKYTFTKILENQAIYDFCSRTFYASLHAVKRNKTFGLSNQEFNAQDLKLSGPAAKSTAHCVNLFGAKYDEVYCVRCPVWPSEAKEWQLRSRTSGWPTKETIGKVVDGGCDLVPVAHPDCENQQGKQWRYSFSRAEVLLLNGCSITQQIVYHMLRVLFKKCLIYKESLRFPKKQDKVTSACEYEEEEVQLFCNYHVKTLILWACEENGPEWWNSANVVILCSRLIEKFRLNFNSRLLPNYFLPQCNLFHHHCRYVNNPRGFLEEQDSMLLKYANPEKLGDWFLKNYRNKYDHKLIDSYSKGNFDINQRRDSSSLDTLPISPYETRNLTTDLISIHEICHIAIDAVSRWHSDDDATENIYIANLGRTDFYFTRHRIHFDLTLFKTVGEWYCDYAKTIMWLYIKNMVDLIGIPCDSDCMMDALLELLPCSTCPCESLKLEEKRRKLVFANRKSIEKLTDESVQNRIHRATRKALARAYAETFNRGCPDIALDNVSPCAISDRERKDNAATYFEKAVDLLGCFSTCSLELGRELFFLLAMSCLRKSLEREDSTSAALKHPSMLYAAALHFHKQRYRRVLCVCIQMLSYEDWKNDNRTKMRGNCLLFLDDLACVAGLLTLFLRIRLSAFPCHGSKVMMEFQCDPLVFAHYLMTLCGSDMHSSGHLLNLLLSNSQKNLTLLDLFLIKVSKQRICSNGGWNKTIVYQTPNFVCKTGLNEENVIQKIMTELSLQSLSSFYSRLSSYLEICCTAESCYRAGLLYNCGRYEEAMTLCDEILNDTHDDPELEISVCSHVLIVSPLAGFFDTDIQFLTGLFILCQGSGPSDPLRCSGFEINAANFYTVRSGFSYSPKFTILVNESPTYDDHFVGRHFAASYIKLRCLISANKSKSEIKTTYRSLQGRLTFERVIAYYMYNFLRRLCNWPRKGVIGTDS